MLSFLPRLSSKPNWPSYKSWPGFGDRSNLILHPDPRASFQHGICTDLKQGHGKPRSSRHLWWYNSKAAILQQLSRHVLGKPQTRWTNTMVFPSSYFLLPLPLSKYLIHTGSLISIPSHRICRSHERFIARSCFTVASVVRMSRQGAPDKAHYH